MHHFEWQSQVPTPGQRTWGPGDQFSLVGMKHTDPQPWWWWWGMRMMRMIMGIRIRRSKTMIIPGSKGLLANAFPEYRTKNLILHKTVKPYKTMKTPKAQSPWTPLMTVAYLANVLVAWEPKRNKQYQPTYINLWWYELINYIICDPSTWPVATTSLPNSKPVCLRSQNKLWPLSMAQKSQLP